MGTDYKDRAACLLIAQRAAFTTDRGLEDRLELTAIGDTYRPYAAAHSWLGSNPKWWEKATGRKGIERRKLSDVLRDLAHAQSIADAQTGIELPEGSQLGPKLEVSLSF